LITPSSRLTAISQFLCNLSASVKGISVSKASQLLRPLQNKPIFPVTTVLNPGPSGYDKLVDAGDASWFIPDRQSIFDSFLGKLPLLATPIENVTTLGDLLHVLRLDKRVLSKLAKSETQPKGRVSFSSIHTALLRAKIPFIKA
jgi:hypothetical protein